MQTREWVLTAAVIIVPLIIAVVVTAWSLDQVRYRPKTRRPAASVARETSAGVERRPAGTEEPRGRDEEPITGGVEAGADGVTETDAGSRR